MRRTQCMFMAVSLALLFFMLSAGGCKRGGNIGPGPLTKQGNDISKIGKETTPPAPAPKISLTASPTAIEMGESTKLSWDSSNATSVTIDNGIGTVEASGSRAISPRVSTTYKATATAQSGNPATAEVRVTVTPPKTITEQPSLPPVIPIDKWIEANIKDVFFDYDQYSIRDDARVTLLSNARLLSERPGSRLTIAGYCDERGSEKYNLALGDRRAIAVKDFLIAQGLEANRLDTISYGKEQNFCEDHNEECWQLNRRAHFTAR